MAATRVPTATPKASVRVLLPASSAEKQPDGVVAEARRDYNRVAVTKACGAALAPRSSRCVTTGQIPQY